MVNIHSLHNGRIPLNLIYWKESIAIAPNAELRVSSTSARLHSGHARPLEGLVSPASTFILVLILS